MNLYIMETILFQFMYLELVITLNPTPIRRLIMDMIHENKYKLNIYIYNKITQYNN